MVELKLIKQILHVKLAARVNLFPYAYKGNYFFEKYNCSLPRPCHQGNAETNIRNIKRLVPGLTQRWRLEYTSF